ncbi:MAG: CCA tRNA nucleotidyltransferase [Spirochaetaceae bacterium]|nr:MAG: CCA tRNA nucleotidyltransferase [Spirochaetaceae bacterium]
MAALHIPSELRPIAAIFSQSGYRCFLVGGAVRDLLMGISPGDLDLATDATPQQVTSLFRRVIPTGVAHGTVTILFQGGQYEVTTFRTETTYSDGRRPDSVAFASTIDEDLSRRDFTINGIALDLNNGHVVDPFGGRDDIHRRVVRAIGEPDQRFGEDALRLLRAIRFAVKLGFSIDEDTLAAVRRAADSIARISAERVRDELTRMILSPDPRRALRLLRDTQLLEHVLPELTRGIGVPQDGSAAPDVFEHLALSTEGAPADRLDLRLAALLHDVAKPDCLQEQEGALLFYGHDESSATIAEGVLRRLRFPNRLIARVCHLIRHHMFHYTDEWTDSAVRRFLARVGGENVEDLFALRVADRYGKIGRHTPDPMLDELRGRITEMTARRDAVSVADLAVNGSDLMTAGIPSGPAVGTTLRFLLEAVMDDPNQNNRARLLEIARRFYEDRLNVEQ